VASEVRCNRGIAFKPAAAASFIGMLTWLFIGTSDLEEILVGGKSFATSSDPSQIFSGPFSQGKKILFGVPVYDGTIGLGYRLPLQDGMTHSPLIFFRYIFTVQTIQVFSVLISMIISLYFANKAIDSWTENKDKKAKFWQFLIFDIALLGPSVSYLLIAEWSTQAVQYFGAVMLISGFVHLDWYKDTSVSPLLSRTILLSITFGLSFFLVGHPGNLPAYFFVIAVIGMNAVFRNFRWAKIRLQVGFLFLLSTVIILPTVLDIYVEGKSQQGTRIFAKSWYESGLDLRFVKQILVGSLWPLLSPIFGSSDLMVKSGYDGFFGLIGVIGLFVYSLCLSRSNPAKKLLIGVNLAIAIGVIQMLNPIYMGDLQPSSLWQIRDPIVASSVIAIAIVFATVNRSNSSFRVVRVITKTLVVAMALNFAYVPILSYSHFVGEGTQKHAYLNQISQSSGKWKAILNASGVNTGERIYLADQTLFRNSDWHGYRNFSQFSGIGVGSINSWSKIRSSKTLTIGVNGEDTKFLSITDSSHGCKPAEIQFLNVSHVLVKNDECRDEYDRVFGVSGYVRKALPSPSQWQKIDQLWLYSLKVFPSTYFGTKDQHGFSNCAVLSETDCISKLGIIPSVNQTSAPTFQLCETGCIASFSTSGLKSGTKIVLPIDFDKTIQVKSEKTGLNLNTDSYNGFLSVATDSTNIENDQLRIIIEPDIRMKINAASPWAHSVLLFIAAVFYGGKIIKKTFLSMIEGLRSKI
jgi:glutaredoxin-related protein